MIFCLMMALSCIAFSSRPVVCRCPRRCQNNAMLPRPRGQRQRSWPRRADCCSAKPRLSSLDVEEIASPKTLIIRLPEKSGANLSDQAAKKGHQQSYAGATLASEEYDFEAGRPTNVRREADILAPIESSIRRRRDNVVRKH